jgi:hypothetical protein
MSISKKPFKAPTKSAKKVSGVTKKIHIKLAVPEKSVNLKKTVLYPPDPC